MILINGQYKLYKEIDFYINRSLYFRNMFSGQYKENTEDNIDIYIPTLKQPNNWELLNHIINIVDNGLGSELGLSNLEPDKILNDSLNQCYNIIHTFNYLGMDIYLNKYIDLVKKYILSTKYSLNNRNGETIIQLLRCNDNIISEKEIKIILEKGLLSINYLEFPKYIINSDLTSEIKIILLSQWNLKLKDNMIYDIMKYQYFKLDNYSCNFKIISSDEFWYNAEHISPIWSKFIKNNLPLNCFVSGGFIPNCIKKLTKKYNDIDIWIYGKDLKECKNSFNTLINEIQTFLKNSNITEFYISIKKSIVNISIKEDLNLQIIFTLEESPHQIINSFDMDYLFSYIIKESDEIKINISITSFLSYISNITTIKKDISKIQLHRIMKTHEKGFKIYVPERIYQDTNIPAYNISEETISLISESDEWNEYRNKYIDLDGDSNRNKFLIKSINNSELVCTSFEELFDNFGYKNFENEHYFSENIHFDILGSTVTPLTYLLRQNQKCNHCNLNNDLLSICKYNMNNNDYEFMQYLASPIYIKSDIAFQCLQFYKILKNQGKENEYECTLLKLKAHPNINFTEKIEKMYIGLINLFEHFLGYKPRIKNIIDENSEFTSILINDVVYQSKKFRNGAGRWDNSIYKIVNNRIHSHQILKDAYLNIMIKIKKIKFFKNKENIYECQFDYESTVTNIIPTLYGRM